MYVNETKKKLRDEYVYGDTELNTIHEEVYEHAKKLFEEKKKGGENLHDRYRKNLKDAIKIEKTKFSISNKQKKIASNKILDEAITVLDIWISVV